MRSMVKGKSLNVLSLRPIPSTTPLRVAVPLPEIGEVY